MPIKPLWQKQTVWKKFLALCLLAAVITAGAEVLFNFRALTTAGLTPTEIPMDFFTCTDETAVYGGDGLCLSLGVGESAELTDDMVYETIQTVHIALEGEGIVQAEIELMDESFAYLHYMLYTATLVADDPVLRHLYAPASSGGVDYELLIRLTAVSASADFTVRSVEINTPIPFRLQPLPMALVFLLSLSLLCAFFLRGFDTAYNPRRPLHRAIVVLPLVGLMILAVLLAAWKYPGEPLLSGTTREEALQTDDVYATFLDMLLKGKVMLDEEPGEALLSLSNPYDPTERAFFNGSFKYDHVLYEGRYYIYFGLAPVLTVYLPYHAITGRFPRSADAMLILSLLTIAMAGWAVCGMAGRYAKGANVFALALCCVTVVISGGVFWLMMQENHYHLPIMALICFSAGAIGFGYHAAQQRRAWLKILQYALSGVCFGLALMTRTNAVPILAALITPLFLFELFQKRARLPHALAFLLPALLGLCTVLWYNKARFGSALDFGYQNQLTALDSHYQTLAVADLPQALYYYLLTPVSFTAQFPYVTSAWDAVNTFGRYKFIARSVGVLVFPVTWGAALMRLSSPQGGEGRLSLAAERRWTFGAALMVSLMVIWVSYCMAGNIMRYVYDYVFFFSLVGALCMLPVMTHPRTPEQRTLSTVCVLLCLASVFISLGLMFLDAGSLRLQSPQVFYGIRRMFYPY